jgi:hypothetical protein
VLFLASRRKFVAHGLTHERGLGVTPKPARETRALPEQNMPPLRGLRLFDFDFYKMSHLRRWHPFRAGWNAFCFSSIEVLGRRHISYRGVGIAGEAMAAIF